MSKEIKLPNRAYTKKQKREVMKRLLAQWEKMPELRFGQLLHTATYAAANFSIVEDVVLCEEVEKFVDQHAGKKVLPLIELIRRYEKKAPSK